MEIIHNIKMYDINEVSQITGMSVRTICKYLRQGTIKGVKISGSWRVSDESLTKYLNGER